jgi:hypothetical protein
MKNEALIENISRDLKPVRPVSGTGVFAAAVFVFCLIDLAAGLLIFPARRDLASRISDPLYLITMLLPLFAMIFCLVTADLVSVPGRLQRRISAVWIWLAFALLAVPQFYQMLSMSGGEIMTGAGGAKCSAIVAALALLPSALLFFWMRRRAPTRPSFAGPLMAFAALYAGLIGVTLHCGNDNAVHVGLWHMVAPLAAGSVAGVLFPRLLRW